MREAIGSCEGSVRIEPHLHKLLGSCEGGQLPQKVVREL